VIVLEEEVVLEVIDLVKVIVLEEEVVLEVIDLVKVIVLEEVVQEIVVLEEVGLVEVVQEIVYLHIQKHLEIKHIRNISIQKNINHENTIIIDDIIIKNRKYK
jgi:hypothetical protein